MQHFCVKTMSYIKQNLLLFNIHYKKKPINGFSPRTSSDDQDLLTLTGRFLAKREGGGNTFLGGRGRKGDGSGRK